MPKRSYNLTDDNCQKLKHLAEEHGLDMSAIVNLSIATFEERKEYKETLQNLKIAIRNCEKKTNILYSALNNFFLNFAGNMDDYVQPYISQHVWLEQAAKDEESRLQMKANKKKWTGNK